MWYQMVVESLLASESAGVAALADEVDSVSVEGAWWSPRFLHHNPVQWWSDVLLVSGWPADGGEFSWAAA